MYILLCTTRAFSTVQALEAAYFRATGKALLLSEQHFLNCAWNVPQNHGCFGGDQDMAFEWVFGESAGKDADHGVIATEAALPYEGVFDYCPATLEGYVRFRGHWSLVEPGRAVFVSLVVAICATQQLGSGRRWRCC